MSQTKESAPSHYPEKEAKAEHPIDKLIARRWSPRLFEDRPVEREKILSLLEAARWAPSCFNDQPWSYLVFDGTDPEALEKARACLVEGNRWARKAPVLMLSVARETFAYNGSPNRHAQHDVGAASEDLVLQAVEEGLVAHQMAGYDSERARKEFSIPEGYTPMAMIAIGYARHDDLSDVDEPTKAREMAERSRKPIREIAFSGKWGESYGE
jgi:nitroreductase